MGFEEKKAQIRKFLAWNVKQFTQPKKVAHFAYNKETFGIDENGKEIVGSEDLTVDLSGIGLGAFFYSKKVPVYNVIEEQKPQKPVMLMAEKVEPRLEDKRRRLLTNGRRS